MRRSRLVAVTAGVAASARLAGPLVAAIVVVGGRPRWAARLLDRTRAGDPDLPSGAAPG